MKRLFFLLPATAVLFLVSCQKEAGGDGQNTVSKKLVRTLMRSSTDSVVTDYTYNGSGKLVQYNSSGVQAGQSADLRTSIIRNSAGIIQKLILKSDALPAGIDSIETIVHYDGANNRYTDNVIMIDLGLFAIRDSIAFQYDAGGKLTAQVEYLDIGSGLQPAAKTTYTYSGNNLLTMASYSYDDTISDYTLDGTSTYEYDSKINPIQFASDAPVLGMTEFYSPANINKTIFVAADPTQSYTENSTYTYNTDNKPATATVVRGTDTYEMTYTYL